jgi:DNA mismatch repair protein MutS
MSVAKITPMIEQYLAIKEKYRDAILFYRMGDFYEMFFEDAKVASRVLSITLTSRNKKDESAVPLCGIPYRAARGYIARLIEKGFKVAICDQTEDPSKAKGLVRRDVVRVITPGMIVENELLDEKENNYILALNRNQNRFGLACLDISTSAFRLTETQTLKAILDETLRICPRELLLPESAAQDPQWVPLTKLMDGQTLTYLPDRAFGFRAGRELLLEQFKTLNLEAFGCEHLKSGIGSAAALIGYVRETQKQEIPHLDRLATYRLDSYLWVDDLSCQNLELLKNLRNGTRQGTLIQILDQTVTAMGGRLLHQWMRYPLLDPDQIGLRLQAVKEARDKLALTRKIREHLKSVYDLERLRSKISMGHANARDMLALKQSLNMLPLITALLSEFQALLYRWDSEPGELNSLCEVIESAIREDAPQNISEGGLIKPGFNAELDELIQISRDGKGWLLQLEVRERDKTGINSLKVRYNKVFGYYIEVSKNQAKPVPDHYVRKQTLVNAERYITDELKSFETRVLGAEERRAALEYEIFNALRSQVMQRNQEIRAMAEFLAQLDCLLNLAEIAEQNDYVQPCLTQDGMIHIEDGRHPVVEKMISGQRFVPNSIHLDDQQNQVLIITGPNMAGKSTVLRQVALLTVMAQMGSFVPARQASLTVIDRIFTRVGALDNLSAGQSTFLVEMQETAAILNHATAKSLVIMDEIGRGTSTFDGLSIAWAVAEHLHDLNGVGVKTLFATHYHELTELARTKSRVKNFNIAVKEWNDEIIFLRKLVDGGTNRSYGIQVARLAGISANVIKRAKEILSKIENSDLKLSDTLSAANPNADLRKTHRQLDLFPRPDHFIVQKLQNLDIARMTPMDALNCLHDLQEKSKSSI